MKEINTKQVLETKIRIYDIPTLERLNAYFDKHRKWYRNKNDFYVRLIRNGLEVLEIQDENYDDYNGKLQGISDKLTEIISAMRESNLIDKENGQTEVIEQIYIQKNAR